MNKIKKLLKGKDTLMDIVALLYSVLHWNCNFILSFKNIVTQKGAFLKGNKFDVKGKNNSIVIGRKARLNNCHFTIIGNNCKIIIGGGSTIVSNVHFWCQDDNSTIIIGNDFTMGSGHIAATEGKIIKIGNDCMFSDDIEIRNGDSHSILDIVANKRINHAESVVIGNHVWLTAHVRVLKGSIIKSNSIIVNSSVVTGKLEIENALYSGIPCKLLKQQIIWDRNKIDHI